MDMIEQKKLNDALIVACANSTFDLNDIKHLVSLGADIHAEDNHALRNSVNNIRLDFIEFLCQSGADIFFNNNIALKYTVNKGRLDVLKALIDNSLHKPNDELSIILFNDAIRDDHVLIAKYLTSVNKNLLNTNTLNNSLISCSRNGYLATTQFLIENGADPHFKDDTPMTLAAIYNHLSLVQYFVIEHHCSPQLILDISEENQTPDVHNWITKYIDSQRLKKKLQKKLISENKDIPSKRSKI